MDKISVAVPWNLSCYIPANGFHPLYRALFENNRYLHFNTIDEVALARALTESSTLFRQLREQRSRAERNLPDFLKDLPEGQRLVKHISSDNLALSAAIPGEIEFLHTSPLTGGQRPFILHCESFLPIFFPFFSQGMRKLQDVAQVRELYRQIFKQKNCLAIYSHLPTTLVQLGRFFRDSEIEAKLHQSRIGLSETTAKKLSDRSKSAFGNSPVFLFPSSAHQNPKNFATRGGYISLLFAQEFLRSGRKARFLFRTKRPPEADLRAAGIDMEFLRSTENQSVFWLENHLPESELLRLFQLADFVLVPSLNLHSVTLMQALAAGAIPVVTDTIGTETYVHDSETGIVLKGVRDAVWHEDPESGIPVDTHELPQTLQASLLHQMMKRVGGLLDNPSRLSEMSIKCHSIASTRFSGAKFRDELSCSISQLLKSHRSGSISPEISAGRSLLARYNLIKSDYFDDHFESTPQTNLLLDLGNAKILSSRGIYIYINRNIDLSMQEISPLHLKELGLLGTKTVWLTTQFNELRSLLFQSLREAGLPSGIVYRFLFTLRETAKETLRHHKHLFEVARILYRGSLACFRKIRQYLLRT